jgi:multiple antibiotic resistance protein
MDLKPLITLVAIVNPLAIVPFFIHYTQGLTIPSAARPSAPPPSAPAW